MSRRDRALGSSCNTGIAPCHSLTLGVTVLAIHAGPRPWQFLSASCLRADGRDVNDDTAVAWVERLHGDCGKLSAQHSADVSERAGRGGTGV